MFIIPNYFLFHGSAFNLVLPPIPSHYYKTNKVDCDSVALLIVVGETNS